MPRTVRFHGIGDASVLRLEEEPLQDPGPGQVRFRTEALGFMFANILFRIGQYPEKAILPSAGVGYEASGIVNAVGPRVTEYREGDRVTSFTNLLASGLLCTPGERGAPRELRDSDPFPLDHGRRGLLECLPDLVLRDRGGGGARAGAGRARDSRDEFHRNRSRAGGEAAWRHFYRHHPVGGKGQASSRPRRRPCRRDLEGDLGQRIDEITGGRGVDLVFDAVGGAAFHDYGRMTAPHGHLMSYGAFTLEMPVMPMLDVMVKQLKVSSYTLFTHTGNAHFNAVEQPTAVARAKRFILDGLELGRSCQSSPKCSMVLTAMSTRSANSNKASAAGR
jgi:hypothetical protein